VRLVKGFYEWQLARFDPEASTDEVNVVMA